MQEILLNLAALDLLAFCKEQGIDPSNSHTVKAGRGFEYHIVDHDTLKPFAAVTFHKHSVPTHTWFNEARNRGKS
jgi:hypothetical protein